VQFNNQHSTRKIEWLIGWQTIQVNFTKKQDLSTKQTNHPKIGKIRSHYMAVLTINLNLYMYLDFPLLSLTSFDTSKHTSNKNNRRSRPFLISCFGSQIVKLSCNRTSPRASSIPYTDKFIHHDGSK